MKIMSVVGARPNFMKIAPFVRAIHNHQQHREIEHILVHTGQHYAPDMSDVFFSELSIPRPDVNLGIGSGSHGYQVGQTMIEFEKALILHRPDWVVVVGDVNATAACAMVARKYQTRVAHIEAGLRSNDWSMPEEINRVVTDRLSNLLFTTDHFADDNLSHEGVSPDAICRVGNVMIDTLEFERSATTTLDLNEIVRTRGSTPNQHYPSLSAEQYAVVTLHRPSNVDAALQLQSIVVLLTTIAQTLPLVFPIHPRTRSRLVEFNFWQQLATNPRIILIEPLTYREMLRMNSTAKIVLTDSGGIQEECTVLGTHCLTIRSNTERPITLQENGGTNLLVGTKTDDILKAFGNTLNLARKPSRPDLWDGHAAPRIVDRLLDAHQSSIFS